MLLQDFCLNVSLSAIYRDVCNMRFSFKLATISPIAHNSKRVIEINHRYAEIFTHILNMNNGNNIYYIDKSFFASTLRYNRGWFYLTEKWSNQTKIGTWQNFLHDCFAWTSWSRNVPNYPRVPQCKPFEGFLQLAIAHI